MVRERQIERTPGGALDRWLTAIEGRPMPEYGTDHLPRCDWCSDVIYPNQRVTFYCVNTLVNEDIVDEEDGVFYMVRKYCADCNRNVIRFPCQGYNELLLEGEIDTDSCIQNMDAIDFSSAADGEPWKPLLVWNIAHPEMSWERWNREHGLPLGPEDIVDDLVLHDIDPREVVNEHGQITLTGEEFIDLIARRNDRQDELNEMVDDPKKWDPDKM